MKKNDITHTPLPVDDEHLKDLYESGLSDETILSAKIRSISAYEATEILGFRINCRCLAFPYLNSQVGVLDGVIRLKPNIPPVITGRPAKYLSRKNSSNRLYIPKKVFKDLNIHHIPLIITEGEKKALAAVQAGLSCVGLSGIYCWKGKSKETDNSNPISDLDLINFKHREIFIIFDSDAVYNQNIRKAEIDLAKELTNRGAKVKATRLPHGGSGQKTGIDDYLLIHSPESLLKLPTFNPLLHEKIEGIRNERKGAFSKKRNISDLVLQEMYKMGGFKQSPVGEKYYFENQTSILHSLSDESFCTHLSEISYINKSEQEFKYLLTEIKQKADLDSSTCNIHTLSFYDVETNTLYMNRFNNSFYKITPNEIQSCPNGKDNIYFKPFRDCDSFDYISCTPEVGLDLVLDKLNS